MAKHAPPLQLSERVYALTGPVNSAIVAGDGGRAVLVDTGQDADHGRRIRRALEELELTPVEIGRAHV